jgi:predicted acyltransferase
MVKRIWTPSFAVFSAGWAFLLLALFYGIIELLGYRRWAFPFIVAGMNSIALYCMSMLMKPWIRERLKLHLG